jgi:predicted ABC-type ATPase
MPAAPTLYLLAGPNGSGKTTLARDLLPRGIKCLNFLNADLLAQGLSPLDPTASLMRAGRNKKPDELGQMALRSFRRAVRAVRAENRKLGLPLVVWKDGRVQKIKP